MKIEIGDLVKIKESKKKKYIEQEKKYVNTIDFDSALLVVWYTYGVMVEDYKGERLSIDTNDLIRMTCPRCKSGKGYYTKNVQRYTRHYYFNGKKPICSPHTTTGDTIKHGNKKFCENCNKDITGFINKLHWKIITIQHNALPVKI